MFHNEIDGWIFGNVNLVMTINQGCQNFFEKIRTKIRTFSEEIRTIRTIFEKKSVQFFFLKFVQSEHFFKPIRTFFQKSVHFFKKSVPITIFEKNPIFEKKHSIFHSLSFVFSSCKRV